MNITLSDLQPDLGRWGRRGGGRRWGGGGGWRRPVVNYYGGGYPYYDAMLPTPVYYVDPVGPADPEAERKAKEEAEAAKLQAIVAAVKEELKKPSGMGQMPGLQLPPVQSFYIDVMGPGARDADIDRIARDDEIVDEAIPAREALAIRRAMGLSGLGDLGPRLQAPSVSTVAIVLGGAVGGYFAADWLIKRLSA